MPIILFNIIHSLTIIDSCISEVTSESEVNIFWCWTDNAYFLMENYDESQQHWQRTWGPLLMHTYTSVPSCPSHLSPTQDRHLITVGDSAPRASPDVFHHCGNVRLGRVRGEVCGISNSILSASTHLHWASQGWSADGWSVRSLPGRPSGQRDSAETIFSVGWPCVTQSGSRSLISSKTYLIQWYWWLLL